MDIYNADLWPNDTKAKSAIDTKVELGCGTKDTEYLTSLEKAMQQAFTEFQPDLILYNAGTDILEGDPLGRSALVILHASLAQHMSPFRSVWLAISRNASSPGAP